MRISFDPKYNIGYIQLLEGDYQLETVSLRSDVNFDLTEDGQVYGIELLNANSQLMAGGFPKSSCRTWQPE
ncbi:MAG: DUF2283 domain-containing protein [bacterium]